MYFLETGLVLVVAPWSVFWERNLLVEWLPHAGAVTLWPSIRGAVSGLGLINLAAGLAEIVAVVGGWLQRRRTAVSADRSGLHSAVSSQKDEPSPWAQD